LISLLKFTDEHQQNWTTGADRYPARHSTTIELAAGRSGGGAHPPDLLPQDNEVVLQPLKTTLSDFRGSVPVSAPQDFDMIRQQVINRGAYRTMTNDE